MSPPPTPKAFLRSIIPSPPPEFTACKADYEHHLNFNQGQTQKTRDKIGQYTTFCPGRVGCTSRATALFPSDIRHDLHELDSQYRSLYRDVAQPQFDHEAFRKLKKSGAALKETIKEWQANRQEPPVVRATRKRKFDDLTPSQSAAVLEQDCFDPTVFIINPAHYRRIDVIILDGGPSLSKNSLELRHAGNVCLGDFQFAQEYLDGPVSYDWFCVVGGGEFMPGAFTTHINLLDRGDQLICRPRRCSKR
ncbi:hypothetical protein MIND_01287900 [Mycena indigotica]|uniref:Uncharacterized protein n=1 Tax=Mycena indigotica TaxID=2126181 RepID=A0A8H6S320_9AGAR|nr:uncharacterized protein MIND_01287900 [Mycena indigotica]KAF7291428.1 hypothetical protein MIND_01287900 [Mycena indigotica]